MNIDMNWIVEETYEIVSNTNTDYCLIQEDFYKLWSWQAFWVGCKLGQPTTLQQAMETAKRHYEQILFEEEIKKA